MLCKSCVFNTERLIAREWHALSDSVEAMAQAVVTILTPRVTQTLPESWQGDYTLGRASRWIARRDQEGSTLLVVDSASRTPVGLIILFESDEDGVGRCVRIGYALAEPAWGRGYASELLGGFVDWCKTRDIASIVGGVTRENVASQRVLEKNGFHALPASGEQQELVYELTLANRMGDSSNR